MIFLFENITYHHPHSVIQEIWGVSFPAPEHSVREVVVRKGMVWPSQAVSQVFFPRNYLYFNKY